MVVIIWDAILARRASAVVMAMLVAVTAGGLGGACWIATRDTAIAAGA